MAWFRPLVWGLTKHHLSQIHQNILNQTTISKYIQLTNASNKDPTINNPSKSFIKQLTTSIHKRKSFERHTFDFLRLIQSYQVPCLNLQIRWTNLPKQFQIQSKLVIWWFRDYILLFSYTYHAYKLIFSLTDHISQLSKHSWCDVEFRLLDQSQFSRQTILSNTTSLILKVSLYKLVISRSLLLKIDNYAYWYSLSLVYSWMLGHVDNLSTHVIL